jgi:hypothetical protein
MRIFDQTAEKIASFIREGNYFPIFGSNDKALSFTMISQDYVQQLRKWCRENATLLNDGSRVVRAMVTRSIACFDIGDLYQEHKQNLTQFLGEDKKTCVEDLDRILQTFFNNNMRLRNSLIKDDVEQSTKLQNKFNGLMHSIGSAIVGDIKNEIENVQQGKLGKHTKQHLCNNTRTPLKDITSRQSSQKEILKQKRGAADGIISETITEESKQESEETKANIPFTERVSNNKNRAQKRSSSTVTTGCTIS